MAMKPSIKLKICNSSNIKSSKKNNLVKKLKICSSIYGEQKKILLKTLVEKLGGTYSDNLTFDVDVLVSASVNSPKYKVNFLTFF
jgi:hypothetical protein